MQNNIEISEPQKLQNTWTSLVEVFRVRTLVLREKWQVSKANAPGFGVKCLELFGILDLNTSSLKTVQLCLFEDLKKSYATFPKSGMMLNGKLYLTSLLDRSEEHTSELQSRPHLVCRLLLEKK